MSRHPPLLHIAQVHALEDAQNREAEQLDRNAALRRECSEIEVRVETSSIFGVEACDVSVH